MEIGFSRTWGTKPAVTVSKGDMRMSNTEGKGHNRINLNIFRSLLCRLRTYGSCKHIVY